MAKISLLPALNDPNGTELVPVVKDGKTMRASVAGLVAGAVAGTVDNLKVDAVAYIGRPGDAVLVDGTPTGIGAIYWHDTVDDTGSVIAVDVFDRAAGTINLAAYRGPLGALARAALTSIKTTGTRTSRRIMLAEPIPVRAGDILAVQPTAGALVVAEVQSGDVGYTYSAPYLPETVALDAPTTNGQVQVRFVIAYRKQVVTADTFRASTAVKIVGPRAVALSSDVNPRGYVEWKTTGQPTAHSVRWGNYTATLDGKAQRMEFPNFSLAQPYAFIGNSLTDSTDVIDRWSQLLAAQYGQPMISVARYSSDWRMVYRVGAKPIVLTLAGALPAAGTVAVTRINGAPIDGNNPAAFLTTGDAGVVSGMAMSGYLTRNGVTRRATVSAPNGASFDYVVTQAPGQTAITFDGPVTFVPDFALSVPGRICVIWLGNNYFFSGVANAYGDYTNPQMWVDLKLIVAFLQARGCRVLLLPVIPSSNTAPDDNWLARGAGTPYTAMESANARTEAMFPGLVARTADGRKLLKFLQDRNDGSPEALDDVAKGFTPRNLRRKPDGSYDLLHMYGDGAGDRAVKDFVDSALFAQALPSAITQTTDFVITAIGADDQVPDVAVARMGRDVAADIAQVGMTALRASTNAVNATAEASLEQTRNLFDKSRAVTGYIGTSGDVVAGAFTSTHFIAVSPGETLVARYDLAASASACVAFYDDTLKFVSMSQNGGAGYPAGTPIIVPATANIRYMRCTFRTTAAIRAGFMIVKGATVPTSYRSFGAEDRYSAFKREQALLASLGTRNLFDATTVQDGYQLNSDLDTLVAAGGFYVTGYMPITEAQTLVLAQGNNFSPQFGICWYDLEKVRVGSTVAPIATNTAYAPPSGAAYARLTGRKTDTAIAAFAAYAAGAVPAIPGGGALVDQFSGARLAEDILFAASPKFFNLYDQNKATFGAYRNTVTGEIVANPAAAFTHDMPLIPGQSVVVSAGNTFPIANTGIAWLDANHAIIGQQASPIVAGTPYAPPTNARFWFVNFPIANKVDPYCGCGTGLPSGYLNAGETVASLSKIWATKRWAMSGDSIVAQNLWAGSVTAFLRAAGYTNWGVAGSKMSAILTGRTQTDFAAIDLYGISSGTNDFGKTTDAQTVIGSSADAAGAATFWGAMRNNIETIYGWKPTIRMFMMTPLHRGDEFLPHTSGIPLKAYRDAIIECAGLYGIPVYDQWSRSGIGPQNFITYMTQGDGFNNLHPNVDGGALIGRQLGRWLEGL